jgi:ABC-type Fe3+/spermidine/putrescine transport system ATPase subunit
VNGEPVARLEGVARRFEKGGVPFELAPTTLSFAAGSLTAITGRSGAGKTTLLHLLAGFERADAGRIHLFGRDVTEAGESALARLRREKIGIVHQQCVFLDHLPLWQNVACRLVPTGTPADERRARARARRAAARRAGARAHRRSAPADRRRADRPRRRPDGGRDRRRLHAAARRGRGARDRDARRRPRAARRRARADGRRARRRRGRMSAP